jgi:hypothetical protein
MTILLPLLVLAVLGTVLAVWLLQPAAVNVLVRVEERCACRYDDGAGHLGRGALVRIANLSNNTVWRLDSTYMQYELIDGKWLLHATWMGGPYHWSPLSSGESTISVVGPVSENATEMKVGFPFTTEWFPAKAHWVFCPVVKIVKKGQDYFPEVKEGAEQEEEVHPLP